MANYRNAKIISLLTEQAAVYLNRHSNGSSLITVTGCDLSDDGKYATILFTVLPEEKEVEALNFAKRQRAELRDFIKDNSRMGLLPFLDVAIDHGQKHQNKIDDLMIKNP